MDTVFKTAQQLDEEDHERYLKKQADMLERRRARKEAEGHKCPFEECLKSFKDYIEYKDHLDNHYTEKKKRMICVHPKCGKKFNIRKEYKEHLDSHQEDSKTTAKNVIRGILLYNKHGLLLESFEKEYKLITGGKMVPYKVFGYNCVYDLLTNLPDVVRVSFVGNQTLLLGVPDETTKHIADMVSNQRTNREGFNYRTGEVLDAAGSGAVKKIERSSEEKPKKIHALLKKQITQLIQIDVFESGISIDDFLGIYEQEFGYPLDFESYGYIKAEDFIHSGLSELLELVLDGFSWKIITIGTKFDQVKSDDGDTIDILKSNMLKLWSDNPYGMTIEKLSKSFEVFSGRDDNERRRNALELCIVLPDVCKVYTDNLDDENIIVLPISCNIDDIPLTSSRNESRTYLCEVKNNVWRIMQSLANGVSFEVFSKGYEGYYGHNDLQDLGVKSEVELCTLMPDVCRLTSGTSGEVLLSPTKTATVTKEMPELQLSRTVRDDIARTLKLNPSGIPLSCFLKTFVDTNGYNLNHVEYRMASLESLFVSLSHDFKVSDSDDPVVKLALTSDYLIFISDREDADTVDEKKIQMLCGEEKQDPFLFSMNTFYYKKRRPKLKLENVYVGSVRAALDPNFDWRRCRVQSLREDGKIYVYYTDLGYTACVHIEAVRNLEDRFTYIHTAVSVEKEDVESSRWYEQKASWIVDADSSGEDLGLVQKNILEYTRVETNLVDGNHESKSVIAASQVPKYSAAECLRDLQKFILHLQVIKT